MRKRSLNGIAFAAMIAALGLGTQARAQMLGNGQYGPIPGTTGRDYGGTTGNSEPSPRTTGNGGYGTNSGTAGTGAGSAPATTGNTGYGSSLGNFGPGSNGYGPSLGNFGPNAGTGAQP